MGMVLHKCGAYVEGTVLLLHKGAVCVEESGGLAFYIRVLVM